MLQPIIFRILRPTYPPGFLDIFFMNSRVTFKSVVKMMCTKDDPLEVTPDVHPHVFIQGVRLELGSLGLVWLGLVWFGSKAKGKGQRVPDKDSDVVPLSPFHQ